LQGIGDELDAVASWVVFRMTNPKAKQLKNNRLNNNGAWQSMSRTDSLKAVDRKPVTLDEQQDCWQTCIAMLLQNTHVKGFPLITTDGNPFKIGGIHEKADASNLAIDGRLFTEPEHDIDMEWILNETIKAFDAAVATVDEQALVLQWETTHARQLRHANSATPTCNTTSTSRTTPCSKKR
jgi:hypothetical protein